MKMPAYFALRRKVALALSIFILLFGSNAASAQNQNCENGNVETSFFRRLAVVESLAETPMGIRPVSEDKAKKIAHYRVIKDGCGRIKEVAYFQGDRSKPIDENYTANIFVATSNLVFQHNGPQTTIRFFEHAGDPTEALQGVASIVIMRDARERPVTAEFRNTAGALTNSSFGYAIARWQWSSSNSAIETRYDAEQNEVISGSNFRFSSAHLEFNARGLLTEINMPDDSGLFRLKRQEDGALNSWRSLNEKGELQPGGPADVAGANYEYDENGYLERLKYLDEHEAPTLSAFGHMGFERRYSEIGNRLYYHFIDAENKIWAPPQRGYAGQNYIWRKDGLVRIRSEYVDAHGALINHPQRQYAVIEYEFDERDFAVRRAFLDASETLLFARSP